MKPGEAEFIINAMTDVMQRTTHWGSEAANLEFSEALELMGDVTRFAMDRRKLARGARLAMEREKTKAK